VEDEVSWRQKSKSDTRLHLDDGNQFSRSAGTPEVESAWTSVQVDIYGSNDFDPEKYCQKLTSEL
jgi:hypothetical protein